MSEGDGVQFLAAAHSRKRQHSEMEASNHYNRSLWDSNGEFLGSSRTQPHRIYSSPRPTLPPLPHMRFPGDGYDFRRPIISTPPEPENVIDLTNESSPPTTQQHIPRRESRSSRPPRFGRNIMADVVDLEREEPPPMSEEQIARRDIRIREAMDVMRQNSALSLSLVDQESRRLAQEGALGIARESALRRAIRQIEATDLAGDEAFRQEVSRRTRDVPPFPRNRSSYWIGDRQYEGVDLTYLDDTPETMDMPFDMDYQTAGFALVDRPAARASSAPEAYKAPSPAPEGFTRTTSDDEVLICPACEEELGTGENQIKQQIWVAKPCGHVYCGECTAYRSISKVKRSELATVPNTKRFAKCLIPDCGKPVSSPKAMFQIYL